MKILHTADWHLGQTFYEYDRREEHLHFLEWLKQQIRQHKIDVLLIAGDVSVSYTHLTLPTKLEV